MTYVLYIVIGVLCLGLFWWLWRDLRRAKREQEARERRLRDTYNWDRARQTPEEPPDAEAPRER